LNKYITNFDISHNPNVKSLNFSKLITDMSYNLTNLNIEGNNMGDNIVVKLCDAILERPVMKILNLSQNMITNKGAWSLAELLKYSESIEALYLKWNFIKGRGGAKLMDTIKENTSLLIFEISFNPLGENKKTQMKAIIKQSELDMNMIADQTVSKMSYKQIHDVSGKI